MPREAAVPGLGFADEDTGASVGGGTGLCGGSADNFLLKSFPGSAPAYVEITLDKHGRAEYREAPKEEDPLVCQLSEADVKQIWTLAEKLNWFKTPLESGLPVAKMGRRLSAWITRRTRVK